MESIVVMLVRRCMFDMCVDHTPKVGRLKSKTWKEANQENWPGTHSAHAVAGALGLKSPKPAQDYEAWQPEG